MNLEEKIDSAIKNITSLHDSVVRTNWAELNREGFVFELEKSDDKLKELYLLLGEINKELKLMLEKNTPDLDSLLSELAREMTVLESNITMEKKKKLRQELVNTTESTEVPELYASLQQKIMTLTLKMRYNSDRVKNFLVSKKLPFVKKGSTARNLLEALQAKEQELEEIKQKNIELKRKTFFGTIQEKSIPEIEIELNEMDKQLFEAVNETKKSLKAHLAQISYLEGSYAGLKKRVEEIDSLHTGFTKKSIELIKELKKERDYAKTLALDIEQETAKTRGTYTNKVLEMEEKKQAIEEKMMERFEKQLNEMKKHLDEKTLALKNTHKIIEQLEEENKKLKEKNY
jgi:hypothetical protein